MAAHRKPSPYRERSFREAAGAPSDALTHDISGAMHPMHRELARRITVGMTAGPQAEQQQWSRPSRMAFIFYAAVGSWGLIGLAVYTAVRLV
jgi:hypothetical protein